MVLHFIKFFTCSQQHFFPSFGWDFYNFLQHQNLGSILGVLSFPFFFPPDLKQSPPELIAAFIHCVSNLACLLSNYPLYKPKASQVQKWTQPGNVSKPSQPESLKTQKINPNQTRERRKAVLPAGDPPAAPRASRTSRGETRLPLRCTGLYLSLNCWQRCHNYAQTSCKYARK